MLKLVLERERVYRERGFSKVSAKGIVTFECCEDHLDSENFFSKAS